MRLAIEAHGLTRRFGELTAVDGIDLGVPAGSIPGSLGPDGAGRSTTVRCLTGLLRRSAGEVRIGWPTALLGGLAAQIVIVWPVLGPPGRRPC